MIMFHNSLFMIVVNCEVRDFSTNDGLEIMVINIDAFSKSEDPKNLTMKTSFTLQ